MSPNQREILSARSTITGKQEYLTSTSGVLNINGSIGGSPLPISGATTGVGVAILDSSGNQISSFGGGIQYTDGGTPPAHPVAPTLVYDNAGTWAHVSASNPLPVSATISTAGLATSAKQDTGNASLASIDGKITAVNTGAVVVASSALPTGASTAALQTQPGVDIGDVTVNNASGGSAVNIQDGGNSITVDGSITVNAGTNLNTSALALDATLTGGTQIAIAKGAAASGAAKSGNPVQTGGVFNTTQPTVTSGQAVESQSTARGAAIVAPGVDNFAVQATLAAETTKIIGAINNLPATVDTNSGNKSASTLRVVLATDQPQLINKLLVTPDANSAINNAQIGGNTISTDVGATGNGTQRVVLANGSGRTLLSAGGSASSSGNNTLVAAGTNKLKVYAFTLSTTSTTAMTCIFQSGASGTELWRCILQAPTSVSTGANLVVQPPSWLFATASATLLNLNLSSANAVHWSVSYFDEA